MEAKYLASALSFLSIFLAIYAQSLGFEHFDSEASTEFEIEPVVIYYGDSNVDMGEPFSITCIIPITEKIHWLKNGEPITRHNLRHGRDEHAYTLAESAIEGEKHKIEAHISVRHALKVHEGRYQCNDRHSSYHMLHVRNAPLVAAKPETKSPFIITAAEDRRQHHIATESAGYQTINELTPPSTSLDEIFTRTWEQQQPSAGGGGGGGGDEATGKAPTAHHHHEKVGKTEHEHERRKHLYANMSLSATHGRKTPTSTLSGESDEAANELYEFAYLPAPTSKYNELTTMPWHMNRTSGGGGGGSGAGGGIHRVYSATPPDFPPPRMTMLSEHTVAPPDAPAIYYNMPTGGHQTDMAKLSKHHATHQHMITANNGGGGVYATDTQRQQQQLQQQQIQTHHYTLAPQQATSATATTTTLTNTSMSHYTHGPHQLLLPPPPQLTNHVYQQQQQQHQHQQQQHQQQQLQSSQPPVLLQTPPYHMTMHTNPYQLQPQPQPQPQPPPYHQYNPQQVHSAYPPQFVTAIALPGSSTSFTALSPTSPPPPISASSAATHYIGAKQQQAKTFLPIKKGTDSMLVPNYDNEDNQLKFFEIRSPLVLSCNVKGNISGVLQWLKNETDVFKVDSLKGRFRIIEAEGKFIIDRTDVGDYGLYSCKVGDVKRDIHAVARVVVRVPSNSGVVEGEKLSIVCTVVGSNPELYWTYGNLTLKNSTDRYILKPDSNNVENALLTIDNVSLDDRGEYKCIGGNDANKYGNYSFASDATTVRVKGKLAALWPFLGICAEVLILCLIILIYEKRRNKSELEESDTDPQEH